MQLTLWQQHVQTWKDCQDCNLCKRRNKVVLGRGSVPADIVFVGEAPGNGEDSTGKPFIGPAGKLLDEIIARSVPPKLKYAITNVIACIPLEGDTGGKVYEPPRESVIACSGRLREFIRICDGDNLNRITMIVCVGNEARDWLDIKERNHIPLHRYIPQVAIMHPAAMLRRNYALRMSDVQEAINTISRGLDEIARGEFEDVMGTSPKLSKDDSEIPF